MSSLPESIARPATLIFIFVCVLAGCGHEQVRQVPDAGTTVRRVSKAPQSARRAPGEEAAVFAVRQIGVPYLYGGSSVRGFDCSGLVQYAWAKAGLRIPRTTTAQWQHLAPVADKNLRVGDLLFFRIDGRISHVGLYLGERRFVHAPSSGREVTVADLNTAYYRKAFVRGARPY